MFTALTVRLRCSRCGWTGSADPERHPQVLKGAAALRFRCTACGHRQTGAEAGVILSGGAEGVNPLVGHRSVQDDEAASD